MVRRTEPAKRANKAESRVFLSPARSGGLEEDRKALSSSNVATTHALGTWPWQAPEVMQCRPHSELCDVYALGVTLWEMWARRPPYSLLDRDERERLTDEHAVYRPPLATVSEAPRDVQFLIATCWQTEPRDRPTMAKVVEALSRIKDSIH